MSGKWSDATVMFEHYTLADLIGPKKALKALLFEDSAPA